MTRDRIPQHGSRTRLLTVAGVILLAAGLSGALLPPMQTAPSIGFSGETQVDLGRITIPATGYSVEHTFRLVNTQSTPIVIEDVITSCACLRADVSANRVSGGDELLGTVAMRLSTAGTRSAVATLRFSDGSIQSLSLRATAEIQGSLFVPTNFRIVSRGTETDIWFFVRMLDVTGAPARPILVEPEGVDCDFVGWELVHAGSPDQGRPARWEGHIRCMTTEGAKLARIALDFPGGAVTGRPAVFWIRGPSAPK